MYLGYLYRHRVALIWLNFKQNCFLIHFPKKNICEICSTNFKQWLGCFVSFTHYAYTHTPFNFWKKIELMLEYRWQTRVVQCVNKHTVTKKVTNIINIFVSRCSFPFWLVGCRTVEVKIEYKKENIIRRWDRVNLCCFPCVRLDVTMKTI